MARTQLAQLGDSRRKGSLQVLLLLGQVCYFRQLGCKRVVSRGLELLLVRCILFLYSTKLLLLVCL
jgi:hypothetical protein